MGKIAEQLEKIASEHLMVFRMEIGAGRDPLQAERDCRKDLARALEKFILDAKPDTRGFSCGVKEWEDNLCNSK